MFGLRKTGFGKAASRRRGWLTASAAFLLGCTTISVEERKAFDVKKTVDDAFFSERGLEKNDFYLRPEPSVRLHGWFIDRPDDEGTVVLFGGNGYLMVTARAQLAALSQLPVDIITFDYRGYGASTGNPSVEGLKRDALSVLSYARRDRRVDDRRVVVHGHSLGSFVALYAAEKRNVAGVVLENPVSNVEALLDGLVPWYLRPLVRFDIDPALKADDNVNRASHLDRPLLVFSGTEDPVAPDHMAETIYRAATPGRARWVSIDGGGHNDLPYAPEFVAAYREALASMLGAPATSRGPVRSRE
ncbi:MAG: alpha/beta hydrolase [Myxococcota bacterium]